jgi:hypothetical protein
MNKGSEGVARRGGAWKAGEGVVYTGSAPPRGDWSSSRGASPLALLGVALGRGVALRDRGAAARAREPGRTARQRGLTPVLSRPHEAAPPTPLPSGGGRTFLPKPPCSAGSAASCSCRISWVCGGGEQEGEAGLAAGGEGGGRAPSSPHVFGGAQLARAPPSGPLTTGDVVLDRLNQRSSGRQVRCMRLRSASFDDRCASKPCGRGAGWW